MSKKPAPRRELQPDDCRACRGTGQESVMEDGRVVDFQDCPTCKGTGMKSRPRFAGRPTPEDL